MTIVKSAEYKEITKKNITSIKDILLNYALEPANQKTVDKCGIELTNFLYENDYYNDDYVNDFRPIIPGVNMILETKINRLCFSLPDYNFNAVLCF